MVLEHWYLNKMSLSLLDQWTLPSHLFHHHCINPPEIRLRMDLERPVRNAFYLPQNLPLTHI